jgi:hypothetical protein
MLLGFQGRGGWNAAMLQGRVSVADIESLKFRLPVDTRRANK